MAEVILAYSYMTNKDAVRITTAKCFSSLIPLLAPREGNLFFQSACLFETYLLLMQALVFILTDENPQIRFYMQNQGVLRMLGIQQQLQHFAFNDANDSVLLRLLFTKITD